MVSTDGSYFALLDSSCSFKVYRGDAGDYISYLTYVLNRDTPFRHRAPNEEDHVVPTVLLVFETPSHPSAVRGQCFASLDNLGVFHVLYGHPNNPDSYPIWSSIDNSYYSKSDNDFMFRAFHKTFISTLSDGALVVYSQSRRRSVVDHGEGGAVCEWSSAGSCSNLLSTVRHFGLEVQYRLYSRSRHLRDSLTKTTSTLSQLIRQLFSRIEGFIQVCLRFLHISTR